MTLDELQIPTAHIEKHFDMIIISCTLHKSDFCRTEESLVVALRLRAAASSPPGGLLSPSPDAPPCGGGLHTPADHLISSGTIRGASSRHVFARVLTLVVRSNPGPRQIRTQSSPGPRQIRTQSSLPKGDLDLLALEDPAPRPAPSRTPLPHFP